MKQAKCGGLKLGLQCHLSPGSECEEVGFMSRLLIVRIVD